MNREEEIAHRVENILKDYGEAIKLSEIVGMTEGQIDWPKNPSRLMKSVMELKPQIQKASHRYGFYVWNDTPIEELIKEQELIEQPIKEVKPVRESNDDIITDFKEEDKLLLQNFHLYTQPVRVLPKTSKYRVDDSFKGKVTGVESYGVFIVDTDGYAGLVHHTCMRRGRYVSDCSQYFKVGDEVTAKVKIVKPNGKISLDTTESFLPDYYNVNSMHDKMARIADTIQTTPIVKPITKIVKKPVIQQEEIKQETPKKVEEIRNERPKEFDQLVRHLQDVVGVVSEPAKNKLENLITSHGLVKFMLTMTEIEKNFKVDLGLKFLEEVEGQMGNRL